MAEQLEAETPTPQGEYFYGTGRRKSAIARVRLYPGSGNIIINNKPYLEVFSRLAHQRSIRRPLEVAEAQGRFDISVKIMGGGATAWAGAISHGLARALIQLDPNLKPSLRRAGLVARDPRVKERKKYGLKRARKAPQYTKR